MPDAPLLALPGGSVLQFLAMTLPLLAVYVYFLWLAFDRPNLADPDDPRYAEDRIRLTAILYTYLATLPLFAALAVYLLWFVPRRRALSRRYRDEAVTVLGDVAYAGPARALPGRLLDGLTRRTDYGAVAYDLADVARHPACDHEARHGGAALRGTVAKRVRVYHRYPRERVSVLVLPDHPRSGQPQADMEADWASFHLDVAAEMAGGDGGDDAGASGPRAVRERTRGVVVIAVGWSAFLLLASLYATIQIAAVEDYYEDEDGRWAWTVFWWGAGGGVVLPCVGNFLRWKVYEHWMLAGGATQGGARGKRRRRRRRGESSDDDDAEQEEGSYVQMA